MAALPPPRPPAPVRKVQKNALAKALSIHCTVAAVTCTVSEVLHQQRMRERKIRHEEELAELKIRLEEERAELKIRLEEERAELKIRLEEELAEMRLRAEQARKVIHLRGAGAATVTTRALGAAAARTGGGDTFGYYHQQAP